MFAQDLMKNTKLNLQGNLGNNVNDNKNYTVFSVNNFVYIQAFRSIFKGTVSNV